MFDKYIIIYRTPAKATVVCMEKRFLRRLPMDIEANILLTVSGPLCIPKTWART